jgi:hypothetical protein
MKQNINLYQTHTHYEAKKLSFLQMMQVIIGFAVVLVCMTIYHVYKHFDLVDKVKQFEQEEAELDRKLKLLEANMIAPTAQEELLKKVQLLAFEQKNKQEALATLVQIQSAQSLGFSGYFKALATQMVPGVWLTNFRFGNDPNYISLEGLALKAEDVPPLIEGLGKEAVFNGKTFQVFRLSMDAKNQYLNFVLQTTDVNTKVEASKP